MSDAPLVIPPDVPRIPMTQVQPGVFEGSHPTIGLFRVLMTDNTGDVVPDHHKVPFVPAPSLSE